MPTAESSAQATLDEGKALPQGAGGLRALSKALAILGALGDLGGRASLSEIARRCGLPKSTAHRVLAVLLAHEAVLRVGDDYVVGGLLHVGANCPADDGVNLRHAVKPFLLEVYEKTRQPAALVVLATQSVVCLDLIFGHAQRDETPPRQPAPLHHTAAGKLFLAFDPIAATFQPARPLSAQYPSVPPQSLAQELTRTRRDGIARCEPADGVVSVAVPIWEGRGRLRAAIEIYGRADRFPWLVAEAAARRAAFGVSGLLRRPRPGYGPVGPTGRSSPALR